LSAIVLNGSSYDSFLYRGPNSTTGLNPTYVGFNGIPINTYHNNIDTYVFKKYKTTQINKSKSYLLQYFYTAPGSNVDPTVHANNWGYVSCNKDNGSSSVRLAHDNARIINGINKLTL
jgi:hypothetical protein